MNYLSEKEQKKKELLSENPWDYYMISDHNPSVNFVKNLCNIGLSSYFADLDYEYIFNFHLGMGNDSCLSGDVDNLEGFLLYLYNGMDNPLKSSSALLRRFMPPGKEYVIEDFLEDRHISSSDKSVCEKYFGSCIMLLWGRYREYFYKNTGFYDPFHYDVMSSSGLYYYVSSWYESYRTVFGKEPEGIQCPILSEESGALEEELSFYEHVLSGELDQNLPRKNKIIKELDLSLSPKKIESFLSQYYNLEKSLGCNCPTLFSKNYSLEKVKKWEKDPNGFLRRFKIMYERDDSNYRYFPKAVRFAKCSYVRSRFLSNLKELVEFYLIFVSGSRKQYLLSLDKKNSHLAGYLIGREIENNKLLGYGEITNGTKEELLKRYLGGLRHYQDDFAFKNGFFRYLHAKFFKGNYEDYS